MWLLPRLRFILGRRPYLYWLVAGCCAALVAARLHGVETAAQQRATAWGTARLVWVSDGEVAPGGAVHAVARRYPTAMVPNAAVRSVQPHPLAARAVAAGQVLVPADLAGGRTPPADWVVLAIPSEHAPRLVPGDGVAVLRAGAVACDGTAAAIGGDRVEIAVPVACAAAVGAEITTIVVARHTASAYRAPDERP
jgi:hypothetical protein